jgi:hypothetical protein
MQSWAGIYFVDNPQLRFLYISSGSENCPVSQGCLGEELESKNLRVSPVLDLVDYQLVPVLYNLWVWRIAGAGHTLELKEQMGLQGI